MIILSLIINHN